MTTKSTGNHDESRGESTTRPHGTQSMDSSGQRPQPERDSTDESLRVERETTDQAIAENRADVEERAETVERAREQAVAEARVQPAVRPPMKTAGRRGRILVVDDEPMIAGLMRQILAAEHEVEVSASGGDALARIAEGERFDVILCDLMMPVMTGMDLHAQLMRSKPAEAERMVFLTGGAFTPQARAFLDAVPNARLEKPFDVATLRAVINDRLRAAKKAWEAEIHQPETSDEH